MMEWLEITVDAPGGDTEALALRLDELGISGLVIEDEQELADFAAENRPFWDEADPALLAAIRGVSRVKFYLPDDEGGRSERDRLRRALPDCAMSWTGLRDEDWENNWKQYYKPLAVGQRLLIVPEWEEAPEAGGRTLLRLDPGLAFGTGSHPSTRMCLEGMEALAPGAAHVLDLGCGSGILAIAALCLGAGDALGCDIDEKAPKIALENAGLNGVAARFTVLTGDAAADAPLREQIGQRRYALIFLNIVADVILRLCADVPRWLCPGGTLLVSGVIDGREEEVRAGLLAAGLTITGHRRMEDWHSFTCTWGGEIS